MGPMVTASILLSACTEEDPGVHCDPYVAGVVDSITSNQGIFQGNEICLPAETPVATIRALVVKFIQTHREMPETTIAASAVVTALTEAFPCKR